MSIMTTEQALAMPPDNDPPTIPLDGLDRYFAEMVQTRIIQIADSLSGEEQFRIVASEEVRELSSALADDDRVRLAEALAGLIPIAHRFCQWCPAGMIPLSLETTALAHTIPSTPPEPPVPPS